MESPTPHQHSDSDVHCNLKEFRVISDMCRLIHAIVLFTSGINWLTNRIHRLSNGISRSTNRIIWLVNGRGPGPGLAQGPGQAPAIN